MQKLWDEAMQAFDRRAKPMAYLDTFVLPAEMKQIFFSKPRGKNYAKRMTRSSMTAKKKKKHFLRRGKTFFCPNLQRP